MPDKKEIQDAAKDFQKAEKGGPDSSRQFAAAGHQARNDAQKAGEDLPKRDASEKSDVPAKENKSELRRVQIGLLLARI